MSTLSDDSLPLSSPSAMDDGERTCRVCRSGEEPGSPLYKPCKCSGSISWIHQDCLESWLSVSRTQRCELCKHTFKWDKIYASQAPSSLPAALIARHIVRTIITGLYYLARFVFVAFIWLAFLPYSILLVWRGLFHLAKGWGTSWTAAIQEIEWSTVGLSGLFTPHEEHLRDSSNATITSAMAAQAAAGITPAAIASQTTVLGTQDGDGGAIMTLSRMINGTIVSTSVKPKIEALEDAIADLFKAWFKPEGTAGAVQQTVVDKAALLASNATTSSSSWLPRSSIIDRAFYASTQALSSKWKANKDLLYSLGEDVFSGQIIVACVIVAFIAAFLLREWVMANQPHVHVAAEHREENQAVVQGAPNIDAERLRAVQDVVARFQEINERREREGANVGRDQPDLGAELRRELGLPPVERFDAITARQIHRDDNNGTRREATWSEGSDGRVAWDTQKAESAGSDRDEDEASSRAASPTASDDEASAGLIRRRGWSSERPLAEESATPGSSTSTAFSAHLASNGFPATSRRGESSTTSTSESTSPLYPVRLSRSASNDFGIESASEGELENEPDAAPMIGAAPAPAANPARRAARAHDLGNDSDTEDEDDDDLFGVVDPAGGPGAPRGQDDPNVFEGDENPDDLFFEADLQGLLEAVGIQGPVLALLQNVALVSLLIASLLVIAVWLPLMFGKTIAATNAQKIILLPVNFVRVFTDPLADRLIGFMGKGQTTVVPEPTLQNRIIKSIEQFSTWSVKKEETTLRQYVGRLQEFSRPFFDTFRLAVAKSALDSVQTIKNQWYAMAVGDSNVDRTLCIALGYSVILAGAAAYLHHTQNIQAREAGAAVRDIVKQHFTLVKAAFFFFVEIVVFPTLCGLLINLSTLPLIPGSTISIRLSYYIQKPVSSIFLTWLAGTNFMFSFAQTISIVRKCIRKGVLYFIRDPADPEANPLREILETPAINQAKKITRSLLVYGAIVLTCFGFFPWISRIISLGVFPLRWDMTRPLSTVPWDLIYLLSVVPLTLGRAKPKRAIRGLFKSWCTITAHQLRLSSFMLGKRRPDEEGTQVPLTWKAWLLLKKAPVPLERTTIEKGVIEEADIAIKQASYASTWNGQVVFRKDGGFARTVAADNVKIVSKKMFVRTHENGEAMTEEGKEAIRLQLKEPGNDDSKFMIVYLPPNFKTRILLFIYLLWLTCAIAIFVTFVSPLVVGRMVLDVFFKEPLHDTYSIIVGIHTLTLLGLTYRFVARRLRVYSRYKRELSTYALGTHPAMKTLTLLCMKSFSIALLAINGAIILPLLVGLASHFYIFIPLAMMFGNGATAANQSQEVGGVTSTSSTMSEISVLMAWCYGVIIVKLACQIAGMMKENWLSSLSNEVKTHGIIKCTILLNKEILKVNRALLLALSMPVAVTYTHGLTIQLIGRYLLQGRKGEQGLPPSPPSSSTTDGQAYVFRISALSVSVSTLAVVLSGPIKRLSKKWTEKVWEKEFVVKRKLRNMSESDGLDEHE